MVQAVELKFNCFFLMPVVDSFPTRLREELESAYDDDIDEVFDVTAVRNALESRLKALESELHQVLHHSSLTAAAMLYAIMTLPDEVPGSSEQRWQPCMMLWQQATGICTMSCPVCCPQSILCNTSQLT